MNSQERADFLSASRALYQNTLLENVVPFWMRHGIDREFGGLSNILDDAGNALNHDKYFWSQGRALWTFSALCNRIEKRPEWLGVADHIYRYLSTHGLDERGHWMFRLDENGQVLDRDTSIYVDGFVMNGLAEYFVASGQQDALQLALETYRNVSTRLAQPGSYGTAPYEIPTGTKTHGVAMIFSFFFFHLGEIAHNDEIKAHGLRLAQEILNDFYVAEKDAILEFVTLDGAFMDTPQGRTCVPGHALEALWFLIAIFEKCGETALIPHCCRLIRRHLELAWDDECGGLMLARDIAAKEPVYWKNPDCKPWWVQVEALVATAFAHVHCGEAWCLEWHRKVQLWAWAHYPVPSGEWTQWLNRRGQPMPSSALPVKDPFHLPRALIYLMEVLGRKGIA
jgi:N-acylglucosamine 2-epimerase